MFVSGENSNKQLIENQSNNGFFGDQCISPPKKVDFDVSKIKSFSSYSDHSVWINNDGKAFAIGNNSRSQINNASYGKFYEKPTQIKIDGFPSSDKEHFVSVVCGDNYTLYMTSAGRLIYMHEKGQGNPLFLKLKIPNPKSTGKNSKSNDKFIYRKPLGLFGGCTRAAVIDEEGDFYILTEELFNSKNQTPKYYSLPESVTNVACCDTFLVALTCSGKVYGNGQINEDNDEFIEIEELSEFGPFTQISGTYEHCLVLNKEGRVYGFGSNYKGRLSLDSEMRAVDTFVLLSVFDDLKVYGISAGFNHSLFLMKEKELASCGTNSYGELLAIKPTKDCYFTPIKTKIIAETKIPYFIAGCNTSFAFVDCDAPPNCPNQNIELNKKRLIRQKSEQNDPSDLTSSVRKKIEDSRSKKSNKYSKANINNKTEEENNNESNKNNESSKNNESNKNNESSKNNSEEVKALKEKIEELDAALKKSEEEKAIIIAKLLEVTQIADRLHNANNELAARVLKYELTLGLLAAVANASDDSDENNEKNEEDDEKERIQKEKEEKERIQKEKEEKEKKEKERIEKEKKEKIRKEKERKELEKKKKQQEAKQNPTDDENKEKQKQKDQQQKKPKQDTKQKSSEDENKQKQKQVDQKDQQQKKVQQKSSEDENKPKQKQTNQKDHQQQQQKKAQQKTNEDENKSNQKQKQTDQKDQQKKVQQKSNEAENKSNQKTNEDENKVKQKQKDQQQQQKKVQQKSSEEENKPKQKQTDQQQKKTQQKSNEAENKSNQKVQQPEEPERDEESSKHRHHRHHKSSSEKQQQENQQMKNPKEPSENINDKDQEQNRKHAPRRKHRHQEINDDSNNQSQKISTPPSILTQKENEQKKSIIKPSVSKPNNKFS